MRQATLHFWGVRWVLLTVVAMMALGINFVYQVIDLPTASITQHFVDANIKGVESSTHFAAGWPFRFYYRIDYSTAQSINLFDIRRLLGDLVIWASVLLIFTLYSFRKNKKLTHTSVESMEFDDSGTVVDTNQQSEPTKSMMGKLKAQYSFSLADMMFITAIAAGMLGLWKWNQFKYEREKQLAEKIRVAGGSVVLGTSVPWPVSYLPSSSLEGFSRIAEVTWDNPRKDLLDEIVKLPNLRSLRLSGSQYDLRALDAMRALPKLSDLRVSGRSIDPRFVSLVTELKGLQSLNLMRTNLTANGLKLFKPLSRLQYLNIVHTDVKLEQIENEYWSNSLRVVHLPRPARGQSDRVILKDLPRLTSLHCYEYDEKKNSRPVELVLQNLPELEEIHLDATQCFAMELKDLPKLNKIRQIEHSLIERVRVDDTIPVSLWSSKINFDNVKQLKSLDVYLMDLESFQIEGCPSLAIGTNTHSKPPQLTLQQWQLRNAFGQSQKTIDKKKLSQLLKTINESKGLSDIDLSGLDLNAVNLSEINGCTGARTLKLNSSGITLNQLLKLKDLTGIEVLEVKGTPIRGGDLTKIISRFPRLKSFCTSRETLGRLRLENQAEIESINGGDFTGSDAVRLINLPKLSDSILLGSYLTYLWLENLPEVKSIELWSPWPAKGKLAGSFQLKNFAAGGNQFTDSVFEPILSSNSKQLEYLTLAHTALTDNSLKKIDRFTSLTSLVLTGTNVSDDSLQNLKSLANLDTLYIDQTPISSSSVAWIQSQKKLRKLSIDATILESAPKSALVSLSFLRSLLVNGQDVTPNVIDQLASLTQLQELRFVDANLSQEMLQLMSQKKWSNLRYLDIRFCDVDSKALAQFLSSLPPTTAIVCDQSDLPPSLLKRLIDSQRFGYDSEPYRIALPGQQYLVLKKGEPAIKKSFNTIGAIHPEYFQSGLQGGAK